MTDRQPPSFEPKNAKRRPGTQQAQRVGNGEVPPPSYAPRRSASASRNARSNRTQEGTQASAGRRPQRPRPQSPRPQSPRPQNQQGYTSEHTARGYESVGVSRDATATRTRTVRPGKVLLWSIIFLLVVSLAWFVYLFIYGNSKLEHVEALSGRADTPGETYLIVGSDKREKGVVEDSVEDSERSDTIMLLQLPDTGHAALISLPRDTLVEIPGYGPSKINAAYSYGGALLLVQTVENLTGLTVDHYVEVSMGGVQNLVNAVGGVNLCYDADVSDGYSGMEWTAGCHDVNGDQALSFSRMRYSDPRGDIGRTDRQRQVVSKVIDKAASVDTLLRPWRQRALVAGAAENLTTDSETSILGLAQAGLGLRSVMGADGLMGTPPISSMEYWYAGQACVQLDPDKIDAFWEKLARGELTSEDLNQIPGG